MAPLPTTDLADRVRRVARAAARQGGRISTHQLTHIGIPRATRRAWQDNGRLIPTVPGVFALGYRRDDRPALLWDALLYAGPGAYLTGACAAHALGLLLYEPPEITVATPFQRRRHPDFTVLEQRRAKRELRDGLPCAPLPELLLELAAEGNVPILRRALEALDYRRMLDLTAVHAITRKGRHGGPLLREALARRLPELALCRSVLEIDFLLLLEAAGLPIPRVNSSLHGVEPDMYWPELGLVVELDGEANHGTPAQKRRDAAKDAHLRAHGLTVIRLSYAEVHEGRTATLARLANQGLTHQR